MRNLILALFLSIYILTSCAQAQNVNTVKITQIVEEINKNDDTTRVLNLWATWCAPCIKELPYFEQVNQEFKDQKVKIFLLAVEDTPESVSKFVTKKNLQAPVMLLDETDASYWIPKINVDWQGEIPVTLISNNANKFKKFHSGELDKEHLIKLIQESSN